MPTIIQELTPPETAAWTTPDQVALRLLEAEVAAGGTELSDLLEELIDEASGAACRVVGRPVARAQYRQQLPGYGTDILRLSRGPLEVEDLTLALRGDDVDPALYSVDPAHALLVRTDGGVWELTARYAGAADPIPVGSDLRNDYAAEFWAGYRMPGDAGTDGTPLRAELRGVVVRMVLAGYREVRRGGAGVRRMKKADREVEWFGGPLPDCDLRILEDERDMVG